MVYNVKISSIAQYLQVQHCEKKKNRGMTVGDIDLHQNSRSMVVEDDCSRDKEFKRDQTIAYRLCLLTIILDVILGLTAFINCMLDKSSVGLSYSIDTLMDSICICFVAWHLKGRSKDSGRNIVLIHLSFSSNNG